MGSDGRLFPRQSPYKDFNPRSPCGERHFNDVYSVLLDDISIHAPRVGSDLTNGVSAMSTPLFQSTLPVWGATGFYGRRFFPDGISIHAPRVGSDPYGACPDCPRWNFNPRSPCGERRRARECGCLSKDDFNPRSPCGERPGDSSWRYRRMGFQSTLPVWGATVSPSSNDVITIISIHAPRVGSDAPWTTTWP